MKYNFLLPSLENKLSSEIHRTQIRLSVLIEYDSRFWRCSACFPLQMFWQTHFSELFSWDTTKLWPGHQLILQLQCSPVHSGLCRFFTISVLFWSSSTTFKTFCVFLLHRQLNFMRSLQWWNTSLMGKLIDYIIVDLLQLCLQGGSPPQQAHRPEIHNTCYSSKRTHLQIQLDQRNNIILQKL